MVNICARVSIFVNTKRVASEAHEKNGSYMQNSEISLPLSAPLSRRNRLQDHLPFYHCNATNVSCEWTVDNNNHERASFRLFIVTAQHSSKHLHTPNCDWVNIALKPQHVGLQLAALTRFPVTTMMPTKKAVPLLACNEIKFKMTFWTVIHFAETIFHAYFVFSTHSLALQSRPGRRFAKPLFCLLLNRIIVVAIAVHSKTHTHTHTAFGNIDIPLSLTQLPALCMVHSNAVVYHFLRQATRVNTGQNL